MIPTADINACATTLCKEAIARIPLRIVGFEDRPISPINNCPTFTFSVTIISQADEKACPAHR
jgi:hypothetical protein